MSYYFISIGGTGAKILESLTHACIMGLLPGEEKLHIAALDPDVGNGNLERTSTALNNYLAFQKLDAGGLFKNKVAIERPYPYNPTGQDKNLDDLIEFYQHSKTPVGKLYEVLYTKKERVTTLNEGFRGHPSIGAAVLAKSGAAKLLEQIERALGAGEQLKIILAGSVFGGTGAAGLPTLARLLRNNLADYADRIELGGLLMLPYFSFTPDEKLNELFARSENFLANTKAALRYYSEQENLFDAAYLIGDSSLTPVEEFAVGSANQRNAAHLVEFYGALAAADFYSGAKGFKYICRHERNKYTWEDFSQAARFVQFTRFILAYIHLIKPALMELISGRAAAYKYPYYVDYLEGVDLAASEVVNFNYYAEAYVAWLKQLETFTGREVALIKNELFAANPARLVDKKLFARLDGNKSDLTLHEIFYRLSEPADTKGRGFGKFLRRLYDCCFSP